MIQKLLFKIAVYLFLRRFDVVTIVGTRNSKKGPLSSNWTRNAGGTNAVCLAQVEALFNEAEAFEAVTQNAIYIATVEEGR